MSATLSNGAELAEWLGATLHVSDFRPIPLDERILLGMHVYDKAGSVVRKFAAPAHPQTDPDHVVTLCSRESCRAGDQVIVFCPTKQFCHNCALKVAKNLKVPAQKSAASSRAALMAQLSKEMSMGVDPILQASETIPHGVAFHHAGLADTERSAIEKAFRSGTLSVLAATSTLGAGVNLPAGRVILRNINAVGGGLSATSYRQMAGRAGRKGAGRARGEAFLVAANKGQATRAAGLMNAGLAAVQSALKPTSDGGSGLTRMVLEAVCGKLVRTRADLRTLIESTLVFHQRPDEAAGEKLHDYAWAALQLLIDEGCVELVRRPFLPVETRAARTATAATSGVVVAPPEARRGGGGEGERADHKREVEAASSLPAPSLPAAKRPKYVVRDQGGRQASPGRTASDATAAAVTIAPAGAPHGHQYLSLKESRGSGGGGSSSAVASAAAKDDGLVVPTKLGLAIFRSSMPPGEGLTVYRDLSEAKNGINLRHPLYLSYLLTPLCPPAGLKPNWERLRAMYASAQAAAEKTPPDPSAHLVHDFHKIGITENHLHLWASRGPIGGVKAGPLLPHAAVQEAARVRRGGGGNSGWGGGGTATAVGEKSSGEGEKPPAGMAAAKKAVRLVAAMALKDVSDGYNLGQVAKSYGMNKGELQSLRQSTATFAGMVASFLKELGWTIFLMLVKGFVPKLSLGVSNQLFPLMQVVPGMSRKEASALFQDGIVNAKSLLAASSERVATALRINVPFRAAVMREGGSDKDRGVGACFRYERRAQILANSARAIDIRREKGNKAQAMKLLKAVQGRLGSGGGGGALAELGGGNDLVCVVSRRATFRNMVRSNVESEVYRVASQKGKNGRISRGPSQKTFGHTSQGGGTTDDNLISEEGDEMDVAMAALLSGVAEEDDSDDDFDGGADGEDVGGAGGGQDRRPEGSNGGGASGGRAMKDGGERARRAAAAPPAESLPISSVPKNQAIPRFSRDACNTTAATSAHPVSATPHQRQNAPQRNVPPLATRDSAAGVGATPLEAVYKSSSLSLSSGCGTVAAAQKSPAERAAEIFTTPRNDGGECKTPGSAENDRTMRTPVRRLTPESSPSSFLYEAGTDSVGPAFAACRTTTSWANPTVGGGGAGVNCEGRSVRDVFAEGPAAVAGLSSAWRRSKCFSFVLGSRSLPWLGDAGGGSSSGRRGGSCASDRRAWECRRSWETLVAPPALPVAPYTVPSGGEGGVPLSQRADGGWMRVVSGIAVSLDGKSSRYLSLPPLLPTRPTAWYQHPSPSADAGRPTTAGGSSVGGEAREGSDAAAGVSACWEALPGSVLESVALFVGFPWLCADCCSEQPSSRCHRHSTGIQGGDEGNADGSGKRRRRKLRPWNQALLVCRQWNAHGVQALNWLTAEEPSGRWGLLRDVMEDTKTTKVCLDMKGALVCLRSLGLNVRGPLEDPAVARWLAEPPIDDIVPLEQQQQQQKRAAKKRKTRLPPPRAPPASLSLMRPPANVLDLWCLQAEATLSLMAEKEQALKDLSLTLPFFLLEMPAVAAAAMMEYSGLAIKVGPVVGARRELELRLEDLEGLAEQLAGNFEEADDKTALASPKRVHDMLYATLGVNPPSSWRASLGPTDTNSLQELVASQPQPLTLDSFGSIHAAILQSAPTPTVTTQKPFRPAPRPLSVPTLARLKYHVHFRPSLSSVYDGLLQDARSFIRAVIQHRYLAPARRSLAGLLATKRRHPHLDGVRVNPRVDLFTATGRMIASDPPLQKLDHKIRLTRSWRTSLAEEAEADVPGLEIIPRIRAGAETSGVPQNPGDTAGAKANPPPLSPEVDDEVRQAIRVILAPRGDAPGTTMSTGDIVGIVEDRCLNDPIYKHSSRDDNDGGTGNRDTNARIPEGPAPAIGSMASLWRESGHSYSAWEAERTRQVLVRLGGRHGRVYSYPADKVFRVQANFFSDSKAEAMVEEGLGARCPWFSKETALKPRDSLVASPGYAFVSADYSQVEMRLMAHLSGDPDLLRVFADGGDVFRRIAAAVQGGGKKAPDITEEERRQTKIVVYGVLYGQSADALVPQLRLSRPEAFKIRQTVLKTYPKLTEFLKKVKDDCKTCGYVETLLGRRRYLPQINSADKADRSRAERQAANTMTQGSAADLLKLAATNVAARLEKCEWMSRTGTTWPCNPHHTSAATAAASDSAVNKSASKVTAPSRSSLTATTPCRFPRDGGRSELARRPACRLVLSIHDELLYEVLEPHAREVAQIVKACMEGACSLSVPLVAHPSWGTKWGSMVPVEDNSDHL
ncbi:unnamed protein product [Scytosiphon promiscuus]